MVSPTYLKYDWSEAIVCVFFFSRVVCSENINYCGWFLDSSLFFSVIKLGVSMVSADVYLTWFPRVGLSV